MKKSLIILTGLLLLAFTTVDIRSMYKVPHEAASVCVADIDLDGDNDIVIGHLINSLTNWTGISTLNNNDIESMELDSFFLNGQHRSVIIQRLDNNLFPDLISQSWDGSNSQIGIVFNFNTSLSNIYNIEIESYADDIKTGDLHNNTTNDIVFFSNNNQYWGVLFNDGSGNFTSPEYYDLGYYPQDIATGDLNNDGTDDIVIGGSTEIYFSKDGSFQNLQLGGHTSRVHIADIDHDGDNDIVGFFDLLGTETDITIFENTGMETFVAHDIDHYLPGSTSSVVTDFNNDTLPDLMVMPASNNGVYILYNTTGFEYLEPEFVEIQNDGEAYRRASCADLDGNGFNDIVIVRRASPNAATFNNVLILFNDGQGNFVDEPLDFAENYNDNKGANFVNYPNPFITETTFEFTIKQTSQIEISVYSLQGKLVKSLTNKKMEGGKHQIKWGGLNNAGQACKPGPYIAYLRVNGSLIQSNKLIIY